VQESFKVSAPGKLMLLGEHAVLHGRRCLVCAVNKRMTVEIKPNNNRKIRIFSELGEFEDDLLDFEIDSRFRFVLTAIKEFYKNSTGFDIFISSDFSDKIGLGSSAAVTAAILGAISTLQNTPVDEKILFDQGLSIIHKVQQTGSGADLAASVFGGVLAYRVGPREIKKISATFPISVIYSGEKTPTTKVIQIVEENRKSNPELINKIYDTMDNSVLQAKKAIDQKNWKQLGEIFNINQGLMDAIGVSNPILADINYRMRQHINITGTKISGSGLGDCVIGIGTLGEKDIPYQIFPMEISEKGLIFE
jgi:mevalonate kinase